jgi:hypothetical protein
LIDSSRKLISIYTISFVISLYLTLLICVQTFDVIGVKKTKGTKHPLNNMHHLHSQIENLNVPTSCGFQTQQISLESSFDWIRFVNSSYIPNYNLFDFFTSSLTARFIQKVCANIIKFKSFLKNFC